MKIEKITYVIINFVFLPTKQSSTILFLIHNRSQITQVDNFYYSIIIINRWIISDFLGIGGSPAGASEFGAEQDQHHSASGSS